mmetsp:Transcript_8816/g.21531  ORF Transcript_8816/g.21531 Transcript_8816/m.21531 type:complete len:636 (+) Transcript_8816:350-2257(+)
MRYGENGCPEYADTGSNLLTLSQMVRGSNPSHVCDEILSSSNIRDISDLITLTFVTRNVRGGKGEKELSYAMFLRIWKHYPETAKKLLRLFPIYYGYWKDLLLIAEKSKKLETEKVGEESRESMKCIIKESAKIMRTQFESDRNAIAEYEAAKKKEKIVHPHYGTLMTDENQDNNATNLDADSEPNISLLAKWLPREKSHFDKQLDFLNIFVQRDINGGEGWESRFKKDYRKQVSKLTSYLSLPEVYLSAQRADEINFHKMASKATLKLSAALLNETKNGSVRLRHDRKRQRCAELFINYIVEKGLKGGAIMPDEIVVEILRGNVSPSREKALDAQWKELWKNVVRQVETKAKEEGLDFNPTKMVPLSDVSGSMCGKPMEVAIALGIGISEITHPAFRDMVLTFESIPKWHKLNSNDSIVKKVRSLRSAGWGGHTNFEAAYDKILEVCIEHRLLKEDAPSLIVFSDMQFDEANQNTHACRRYRKQSGAMVPMHGVIRSKFANAAQVLNWNDMDPTLIIYWNLRDTGGHPVDKDTEGVVLLAGFSPFLLKLVMNGDALKDIELEVVQADGTMGKEKIRVTPSAVLRKMLDDPLYDPVRNVLANSNEGVLKDYNVMDSSYISVATDTEVSNGEFELI